MPNNSITIFDATDTFNEKCKPLLQKLINECRMARIPCYFTACVKNDGNGSVYSSDGVIPGSSGIVLAGTDKIAQHLKIGRGFIAVDPEARMELIMTDDPDAIIGFIDDENDELDTDGE